MNVEENEENEFYDKTVDEEQDEGDKLMKNFDEVEPNDMHKHHDAQENSDNEEQKVSLNSSSFYLE